MVTCIGRANAVVIDPKGVHFHQPRARAIAAARGNGPPPWVGAPRAVIVLKGQFKARLRHDVHRILLKLSFQDKHRISAPHSQGGVTLPLRDNATSPWADENGPPWGQNRRNVRSEKSPLKPDKTGQNRTFFPDAKGLSVSGRPADCGRDRTFRCATKASGGRGTPAPHKHLRKADKSGHFFAVFSKETESQHALTVFDLMSAPDMDPPPKMSHFVRAR